ncbi:MAG TPA: trehalose-phosphatase [Steroidobacteraceae bacterium]|nr:trehalose-phosphatase [Steroidobacteraceae bacterium]
MSKHDPVSAPKHPAAGPDTIRELPPPAPLRPEEHAFFFDVDGTLVDYAARPCEVRADEALLSLLRTLKERTGGAVALVSGRSIASVDAVMHPEALPASGLHGFEQRDAAGSLHRHRAPVPEALARVRAAMQQLARRYAGLEVEDKDFALALHFRGAPQLGERVHAAVQGIPELEAGGLRIQRGHLVVEVAPAGVNKGSALAHFMECAPFKGRRPVYAGDDLTDEPAFHWVNLAGGVSIAVRPRRQTAALTALPSVAGVRAWLQLLLEESP